MKSSPSAPTDAIARSMHEIVSHLTRIGRPVVHALQPGLSREDIEKRTADLPLALIPDLMALYETTDGTRMKTGDDLDALHLFPGFYLLSLGDAVRSYRQFRKSRKWKESWFPVFGNDAGDAYAVSCSPVDRGVVIGFVRDEEEQPVEYLSLPVMLDTLVACFAEGAFLLKRKEFTIDDEKHRRIAIRMNPGIASWTKAENDATESARRAEAMTLAKKAFALIQKKKVWDALPLLETALQVSDLPPHVYVNGVYCVQSGNNGRPIDPQRIRKMLDVCLPHGEKVPDVFVNAAFAYMELAEPDACIECLRKAKRRGVDLTSYLAEKELSPLADDERFIALQSDGKAPKSKPRRR